MKELSIEEKAKRYDEVIPQLKGLLDGIHEEKCDIMEEDILEIFPELKENEESNDEEIRKVLLELISTYLRGNENGKIHGVYAKDILDWIEKQGEQKPADLPKGEDYGIDSLYHAARILEKTLGEVDGYQSDDGILEHKCAIEAVNRLYKQKPADNAEPKFHKGDWVVYCNDDVDLITGIEENGYSINNSGYIPFVCASDVRLWTIQDAKDGDVLAAKTTIGYPNPFIAIYKEHGLNFFNSHCFVSLDGEFHEGTTGHSISDIHPATKEQRDQLEKAMADAGYTFDFDKKELKKIEQKPVECSEDNLPEFESYLCLMFQKFRTKGVCTNGEIIDFVKEYSQKLKDTLCHAWSKEDESIVLGIEQLCNCASLLNIAPDKIDKIKTWLKSLKYRVQSQPKQEWSEEDEKMLVEIVKDLQVCKT